MSASLMCLAIATLVTMTGCGWFNPNYAAITQRGRQVHLILDSVEVQRLVSKQSAFRLQERSEIDRFTRESIQRAEKLRHDQSDEALLQLRALEQHPELYIPEQLAFLDAMAKAPGVIVPGKSHCRIIAHSEAICSRHPQQNPTYVKVRVTDGPSKGQIGWGCLGDGIQLNVAMP